MENTIKSPMQQVVQRKIASIEAMELAILGFVLWGLAALIPTDSDGGLMGALSLLLIIEGGLLGSWGIYNIGIGKVEVICSIERK